MMPVNDNDFGQIVARGAAETLVGGTAAVIGGGKFANGAYSAAFVYVFNQMQNIAYEGAYHDELVRGLADDLRKNGLTVETEIDLILMTSGVKSRVDLMVRDDLGIYAIEVKTGSQPRFTENQKSIFPSSDWGNGVCCQSESLESWLNPWCAIAACHIIPILQIR